MKGNYRKPRDTQALDRERRPGQRELRRRAFDAMFAKAEAAKPKPRPPVSPQESKKT